MARSQKREVDLKGGKRKERGGYLHTKYRERHGPDVKGIPFKPGGDRACVARKKMREGRKDRPMTRKVRGRLGVITLQFNIYG